MARITAQVLRGQYAGVELTPHRYPNGAFRVSLSSNKAADAVDGSLRRVEIPPQ
jgi:hypothetical protein